jgi:hypothetical protein
MSWGIPIVFLKGHVTNQQNLKTDVAPPEKPN